MSTQCWHRQSQRQCRHCCGRDFPLCLARIGGREAEAVVPIFELLEPLLGSIQKVFLELWSGAQ